jgi:hypothetical protein
VYEEGFRFAVLRVREYRERPNLAGHWLHPNFLKET